MANLINGLGGVAGFGYGTLGRVDDQSSMAIDLTPIAPNGLKYNNTLYYSLFVNANGSVTFQEPRPDYTPEPLGDNLANPEITPFFADVDTRLAAGITDRGPGTVAASPGGTSTGSNQIWFDYDVPGTRFIVTWDDVGYFFNNSGKVNAFQLIIDAKGGQNFDFEFRYEAINWTTGDASGGVDGLGGTLARAGYATGRPDGFLELVASGNQENLLNLDSDPGNFGELGVWRFSVRDGAVETLDDRIEGTEGSDFIEGGAGSDTIFGGGGADIIYGNTREDMIYGNAGNDQLFGGQQDDTIFGGQGSDVLFGGSEDDFLFGNKENDALFAGDGDDTLHGGQGTDTLIGGSGADVFMPSIDIDIIADFELGVDVIMTNGLSLPDLFRLISAGPTGETLVQFDNGGGFLIENVAYQDASILMFV